MGSLDPKSTATCPVVVVGAGPTGLMASILLSQSNIDHVLFERFPSTSLHPKAVAYNLRTMEIFRRIGFEELLKKVRAPFARSRRTAWYNSFGPNGREIVARDGWGGGQYQEVFDAASPCEWSMLPQIRLEPMLLKMAKELNPKGIFHSTEVLDVEDQDDHVLVTYQEKGEEQSQKIKALYCIGADGGRTITDRLGIPWEGARDVMAMVSAHIRAPVSLHNPDNRNFITWFVNPRLGGTIGSGFLYHLGPYPPDPETEEWCFACGVKPGETNMDGPAMLRRIHNTLQVPDLKVELLSTSYWTVNSLTAARYRNKPGNGRIFLAGDAAHRVPPWGALGLNTGVQDVDSLVWKLNLAINGVPAGLSASTPALDQKKETFDALLDTYDTERRPIGERVRDLALHNLRALGLVMDHAIGVTPQNSEAENIANMESLFEFDRAGTGEAGRDRRDAVNRAAKLVDDEFNALGAEIGWFYPDLDVDAEGQATNHDGQLKEDGQLDIVAYRASTIPGHHLPHAWLERESERVSTRDLFDYQGFVLFSSKAGKWKQIVSREAPGVVTVVAIIEQFAGLDGENMDAWKDVDGRWAAQRGVESSGAVLVRPDGIVVWRAKRFDQELHGKAGVLKGILRRCLGLK
jgi:2-polyprenyl-6-methoxyphenol hydroxylase-like FAD-dependent oxidoreductase